MKVHCNFCERDWAVVMPPPLPLTAMQDWLKSGIVLVCALGTEEPCEFCAPTAAWHSVRAAGGTVNSRLQLGRLRSDHQLVAMFHVQYNGFEWAYTSPLSKAFEERCSGLDIPTLSAAIGTKFEGSVTT